MDIQERVGNNIRYARKRKGLTQQQLAKKMGCSVSMICGVEKGSRRVTLAFLERIGNALEINYMDLIDIRDTQRQSFRI